MNKDSLAKMAQESLDDAMEMMDNSSEQRNDWIPFYIGKAWALMEVLQKATEEEPYGNRKHRHPCFCRNKNS